MVPFFRSCRRSTACAFRFGPTSSSHRPGSIGLYYDDPTRRRNVTDGRTRAACEPFREHRQRMRAVAYRMLGSPSEADDAVQEAWLRLDRSGSGGIENLGGWLTTVVGRVCLNMLRSRGSRRERFLEEPWGETSDARMPDPIVDREDGIDPEHEALLADGIGLAMLVVLETL